MMTERTTVPGPVSDVERVFERFTAGYRSQAIGRSRVVLADCLEWLASIPENSITAMVIDPPYGVK